MTYSFGYDMATVHTIDLPVTLMGMPVDRDREIKVIAVADSSTMIENTHYTITDAIIPAGAINGTVHINLLRDKDPLLQQKEYKLRLTVGENEDLKSVGNNAFIIVYSDIRPDKRPEWWREWNNMVYSYENVQLFFEYFYRLAPAANIDIFNEMISRYGDYFALAGNVLGPFATYDDFLRQYVLIPIYREHPEIEWYNGTSPEW